MTVEEKMKRRGEDRIWKTIFSKNGSLKKIPQTQIGQQLILKDAERILPDMRNWIEKESYNNDRAILKKYFKDDDFLLLKVVETMLLLSASVSIDTNQKKQNTRHLKIHSLIKHVFKELTFENVWRFTENLIEFSEIFDKTKDYSYYNNSLKTSVSYVCLLSDIIIQDLTDKAVQAFFPEPMITPPLDWTFERGKIKGGYDTFQYDMIRSNFANPDYTKYSKNIFNSINYIQSVEWKVNGEILQTIKSDLKMPVKSDFCKITYPKVEGVEWSVDLKSKTLTISKEKEEQIRGARVVFYEKLAEHTAEARDFESAMGKYRAVVLALDIAERFKDEEKIYFPHSFDFRGRIYPLPVGLSPQGSDAVKAMLKYSKGYKLTKWGEKWAWAYLTSLYGEDKIDFKDRVKRGKELLHAAYQDADEPYQFLAHQLELKKLVENPDYEFNGRIHLDACNSGSQFTSALTGDEAGCKATNVIPTINKDGSQDRQDAYMLVSDKALELTKKMLSKSKTEEEREALELFKNLLSKDGRKICKKPVMVSNYGGTEGGRTEIIKDTLRELKVDRKYNTNKAAAKYSSILGRSISGVLNGGKAFETYIQSMNSLIAARNKAITWMTSDGFFVTHIKNKELKGRDICCKLPGSKRITVLRVKRYSKDVSPAKMKSAISPNYVHSLDAELLRRVALKMRDAGIFQSDWIHDSFGCHPNHVDFMLDATKDEFKKLVQRRPLKALDTELRQQTGRSKPTLKKLEEIKVPINNDFDYDLPLLEFSNWFFS